MSLKETLSKHWNRLQHNLFPEIEKALGTLTEKQIKLVTVLESVAIERFLQNCRINKWINNWHYL